MELHGGPHDGFTAAQQPDGYWVIDVAGDLKSPSNTIVTNQVLAPTIILPGDTDTFMVYGAHDGPHQYRHEYGSVYRHQPVTAVL